MKQSLKPELNLLKNERGIVLATAYFLVSVIAILAVAVFSREQSFVRATEINQNRIVAFNMAEAALDTAVANLKLDSTYAGTNYSALNSAYAQGGYQAVVTTPNLDANIRMVQATGYSPSNDPTSRAYQSRTVVSFVQINDESYFDFAVFAKQNMQLNGNATIDSYDSSLGAYNPVNAGAEGDIGTNSIGNGTVTLNGNVTVNGDAQTGPNSDPNNVISMTGNAVINGDTSSSAKEKDYPSVTTAVTEMGPLKIQGNLTVTLAGGVYHYSSIDIKGNGKLNVTGEATVYVSGEVSIAGNGIGTSGNKPPNLLIYVTTNDTVKVTGNGDFYGGIYAPDSHVQVSGNGDLFGAVVSNTYHQAGNGDIHFDEAMVNVGKTGESSISMLSWQEQNTLGATY